MCAASAILTTLGTIRVFADDSDPEGDEESSPIRHESTEPTIKPEDTESAIFAPEATETTPDPPTTGPPYKRTCRRTPPHSGETQVDAVKSYYKGNHGRLFQCCAGCRGSPEFFLGFCDQRGILPQNSVCGCGLRTRQVVGESDQGQILRFRCANAVKDCGFRKDKSNEDGEVEILSWPEIQRMRDDEEI